MSAQSYFSRSPFHSIGFSFSTCVLVAFEVWGVKVMHASNSPGLRSSQAIFGLIVLPVAIWVWSIFLYLEIRISIERSSDYPRHSRLPGLHQGLVLGTTLMSWSIITALVRAFR
jgi:hypothetical protein